MKAENEIGNENRPAGKRRGKALRRRILAMFVYLAVMVAVMFFIVSVYSWIRGRFEDRPVAAFGSGIGEGSILSIDGNGNVVDADGNVIGVLSGSVGLTSEEVELQVADARQQAVDEVLDGIRTRLNDGDGILQILRPLYPDDLVVYSGGQYNVVPINYNLKQHQLDNACLNILDTGEYQYLQDGQVVSHKGIDVSKFQGSIDWNLVAQDGVEFAFIRVGYRGYGSSGKLVEDEYFEANIKGALAAGIKVGVYFYSQAIDEEEAKEEADFVLERIAPYTIECPVVFDVERVTEDDGRMNALTPEVRTSVTQTFCEAIESAGYRPMIYHNTEMGVMMLGLEALEKYDKWFAAYSDIFYYPYDFKIWQYSQTGRVQGIASDVDLNISFAPLWEE